jgi:hypothetical protein
MMKKKLNFNRDSKRYTDHSGHGWHAVLKNEKGWWPKAITESDIELRH